MTALPSAEPSVSGLGETLFNKARLYKESVRTTYYKETTMQIDSSAGQINRIKNK